MPYILLLETATKTCSVALAADDTILSIRESNMANSHSSVITTYIDEVVSSAKKNIADLDAICISMGPGSYTGLRIGVSTAKGLCFALGKPLIAVNTLQSMAMHFISLHPDLMHEHTLLCPMIDARRMEVYMAVFDKNGAFIKDTSAEIVDENSFSDFRLKQKIIFFGDGAEKCKAILSKQQNFLFEDHFQNSAAGMLNTAFKNFESRTFVDTAYFEPFYLKDFLSTKPKKLF